MEVYIYIRICILDKNFIHKNGKKYFEEATFHIHLSISVHCRSLVGRHWSKRDPWTVYPHFRRFVYKPDTTRFIIEQYT